MGFDLRGLKPNDETRPDEPNWLDESDWAIDQREAWMSWQQNTPGAYFRNNVWYWRPLWNFVCEVCDDILTQKDMEKGMENSGHVISKTKAKKIASRLRKMDKDLEDHQIGHERHMSNLKDVECDICYGTGRRNDDIGVSARNADPDYTCNGCNGKGTRRPFAASYPFDADNVREFGKFCSDSGGFDIW